MLTAGEDVAGVHLPYTAGVIDAVALAGAQDRKLVRVAAWYDNEWGFSCRMLDIARIW